MAYASGTAANYKDLLAIMVTFAAANGWMVLEQSDTKVYLKGTGLAGLDEIYCGVETYEDPPNNRYNWNMVGSWGYRPGRTLDKHPVSSSKFGTYQVVGYFWNSAIPYWMVANPRRIMVFAKIGTTYQSVHLGLIDPAGTDAQYPYPLLIGGAGNTLAKNYSDTLYQFWSHAGYYGQPFRVSAPGGTWGTCNTGSDRPDNPFYVVGTLSVATRETTLTALNGSYHLEPLFIRAYSFSALLGTFDGLFRVTGYNNTAENIITVDGVNYMVFPDGSRAGFGDYCALRLN